MKTLEILQAEKPGKWEQSETGAWVHESAEVAEGVVFGSRCIVFGGEFRGGVFHSGVFHGGVFRGGVFRGGVFRGGVFHGGFFHDGVFHGGFFHGGVLHGGVFHGGVFHGGVFHGGVFHGGVFHGGVFHRGFFRGGEFLKSPVYVQGSQYPVCEVDGGFICSGCLRIHADEWTEKRVRAEATKAGYTEEEIKEYVEIFAFVKKRMGF